MIRTQPPASVPTSFFFLEQMSVHAEHRVMAMTDSTHTHTLGGGERFWDMDTITSHIALPQSTAQRYNSHPHPHPHPRTDAAGEHDTLDGADLVSDEFEQLLAELQRDRHTHRQVRRTSDRVRSEGGREREMAREHTQPQPQPPSENSPWRARYTPCAHSAQARV
jgi:hypothetical protein